MTVLAHLTLALAWLPAVACCAYLLFFTLLSGRPATPARSSRRLRFDIIVPAHNEAGGIERTVASLKALDWPRDQYRIFVVADNCTDTTAALARSAGAYVIERHDTVRRGKGFALQYAFRASNEAAWADAVVVVDADSEASPNLLEALASRIESGADAVQVRYGVLNADASWRTRLAGLAKACFHDVRSRARERLELSCGIRGNGWCVTHCLLSEVPYEAFSIVEDVEYGITLGLAGQRIHYVDEACVRGEMPSGDKAATTQRQRWEGGRSQLRRTHLAPLLKAAWSYRDPVCADLALDLIVPPLTTLLAMVVVLGTLTLPVAVFADGYAFWLAPALFCGASLATYLARGAQLSGMGLKGAMALLQAPRFVAWKLLLALKRHTPVEWIRTGRDADATKVRP